MTLDDLFTKWDKAQADANITLEAVPSNILPGMTIRKTQATAALEELTKTYRTIVAKAAIGVLVVGSEAKGLEFGQLGEEEGGGVTVNSRDLYTRIAKRVDETFGNAKSSPREFGYIQFNALVAELADVGRELGLESIPRPAVPAALILRDYDTVYKAMRKIVRGSCGDELNAMYMENRALNNALAQRYNAPVLPVYIAGVEEDEAQNLYKSLLAKNNVVINVIEETVDRNLVVGTLNTIKQALSNKKPASQATTSKKKSKTKTQETDTNNEQQ